jgi:hypothetical protein
LREDLRSIFERELSKSGAKCAMRAWIKRARESGLGCFDRFIGTLDRRLDEITNYFNQRETSGFVEGFNNKAKVLKRRCYGIYNLGRGVPEADARPRRLPALWPRSSPHQIGALPRDPGEPTFFDFFVAATGWPP